MIRKEMADINRECFAPKSMHVDLLKHHPDVIPVLAEWIYEQWHTYDYSLTKDRLITSFSHRLNDDQIPLAFVVWKSDLLIGTLSVKHNHASELADFPQNAAWIGSLQVIAEERNQGVGQGLITLAKKVGAALGHKTLYLYTSNPLNVDWYLARGGRVLHKRLFRNHTITVIEISSAPPRREEEKKIPF